MKLLNFASLDPAITNTGRKGLSAASKLDRAVWAEFQQDWETQIDTSVALKHQLMMDRKLSLSSTSPCQKQNIRARILAARLGKS